MSACTTAAADGEASVHHSLGATGARKSVSSNGPSKAKLTISERTSAGNDWTCVGEEPKRAKRNALEGMENAARRKIL